MVHEEHATIALPEGVYEVVRQREYDPAVHGRRVQEGGGLTTCSIIQWPRWSELRAAAPGRSTGGRRRTVELSDTFRTDSGGIHAKEPGGIPLVS